MESDAEGRHPVQRRDVHSESGAQRIEADIYDGHHGKAAQPDPFDPPGGKIVPEGHEKLEEAEGVEAGFVDVPIPHWKDQITFRGLFVSLILGTAFSIITHRLNLTVGVIPSLNVAAGLLGYFMVASWTKVLKKLGFKCTPFTRQENTVIQTCVVACYGIAFSGGLGSYLLGMTSMAYDKLGDVPGNTVEDIKDLELGWIYAFTFVVSLLGIFVLVPLRKIMIIDYKLIYPSGTATAVLINSFHTPSGAVLARKQIRYLGKYFTFSFAWSFFKWFFSGIGGSCGFDTFPSLGLKAYANRFYFDFNMTYVGAGIICPHLVNCSVMFGAIISWGLLWPLVKTKEGDWYPEGLKEGSDFKGLFGYKVFICISIILGDGLYNFTKVTFIAVRGLYLEQRSRRATHNDGDLPEAVMLFDERRRNEVFQKDNVSPWIAVGGYVGLAIVSIIVIPILFSSVKWYYVIVAYLIAPIFAFCNAYGTGLTDWSLASNYGKLLLFVFAAWAGGGGGGILAGLAACGVMMSIVAVAADLMQDFKTGYMTLSSPRSMFVSQLVGAVMGCIIGPSTFWLYWTAFDIGAEGSLYQAPYAVIYRTMALIGVEGFGSLPRHCLQLCAGWFAFAMLVNAIRDKVPYKYSKYIPIPMAMAIPFYIGAYFAIDMFIGTCIVFAWEKVNRKKADTFSAAVASGLICGDGLWTIPAAILNFAKVDAPICMYFFRSKDPLLPG